MKLRLPTHDLAPHERITALAFDPSGARIAAALRTAVFVYDAASGAPRHELQLPAVATPAPHLAAGRLALAISPDGAALAVAALPPATGETPAYPSTVRIFDLATGALRDALELPRASRDERAVAVSTLAFSPDGASLALGTSRGVALWAQHERRWRGTIALADGAPDAIAFDASCARLAATNGRAVTVADADTALVVARAEPGAVNMRRSLVAFDPAGANVLVAGVAATSPAPVVLAFEWQRRALRALPLPAGMRVARPLWIAPDAGEILWLAPRGELVRHQLEAAQFRVIRRADDAREVPLVFTAAVVVSPDGQRVARARRNGLIVRAIRPRDVSAGTAA